MAKSYTSTINVNCWKEHTCVLCGGVYAYQFARKVTGSAPTAEKAQIKAKANVAKTLQVENDLQPCPTCGVYQPDMIGLRRARKHWAVWWIALIALGIVLIVRAGNGAQTNTLTWVAAILCGLAAAAFALHDRRNPNQDTQSNRNLAQERVTAGQVRNTPGKAVGRADIYAGSSRTPVQLVALGLLLASIVPAAAPEIVRSSRGWPLNAECYPPVVGAGDSTRIYMPQKIISIKSYWNGNPEVVLQSSDAADVPVTATTNQEHWNSTIEAKDDEKSNTSHPWVNITLPEEPNLAGKTVTCDIQLSVTYPQMSGSSTWRPIEDNFRHSVTIHLAPAHAGGSYDALWWEGTIGAIAMVLVSGLLLISQARSLQRQGKPTRTFV